MSYCPSCGRYIGPYKACPHCGARLTGRISIRALKIAALTLAGAGLAVLWLAATHAEVPHITIGQISATMNLAYVRIGGYCPRSPTYDPESGYLGFWIEDGTGEIYVSAYQAEARQLVEAGHVPAPGDQVEVVGTLRVREDHPSLTINAPEQLTITRTEPVERDIGSIAPEDEYLRVRVRGQVHDIYQPYQGLTLITIRDESGTIPIAVSHDLIAMSGISPALHTGQSVEVAAAVSLYGNTPQLVPASVADIVPLSQPVVIATEKQIGALTMEDVGQTAIVCGTVTEIVPFSSGVKIMLDDGTGAVIALLWQSVYDGLPDPAALDAGAEVQVQGEISQYRGELEVIPELPRDVQVVATAPPPTETTLGALTAADTGRVVTVSGTLGPPDPFSAGVKFLLDDGTGQIILLLWDDIYEDTPEGLDAGTQVIVTGKVAEYQGELELIPRNADEVRVIGKEEAPPPVEHEARAVGDITPDDVGQTFVLVGTLGEPESFSRGIKFPLMDGTGTITLLLWQDIYEAIPDAGLLVAGVQVEVVGRIDEYQGDLEIIPEADGVRVTK